MAMSVSPQSPRVPIGTVNISGKDTPVYITTEWYRFIATDVFKRIGAFDAMTNIELGEMLFSQSQAPIDQSQPVTVAQVVPPNEPQIPEAAPFGSHSRVEALEAMLIELRKELDGLKQGLPI